MWAGNPPVHFSGIFGPLLRFTVLLTLLLNHKFIYRPRSLYINYLLYKSTYIAKNALSTNPVRSRGKILIKNKGWALWEFRCALWEFYSHFSGFSRKCVIKGGDERRFWARRPSLKYKISQASPEHTGRDVSEARVSLPLTFLKFVVLFGHE